MDVNAPHHHFATEKDGEEEDEQDGLSPSPSVVTEFMCFSIELNACRLFIISANNVLCK